jgi:hypothetical protein
MHQATTVIQSVKKNARYVPAAYFALVTLTTIGYGDITAATTAERAFIVCVLIIGAILYTLVLGLVTSLLSQLVSSSQPLTDATEALDTFLDITGAEPALKKEVMDTLEYQWRLSSTFHIGHTVRELPSSLRQQVLDRLHKPMLLRTPFLAHSDGVFVAEIAQNLRLQVCLPGAHIYSTGNVAADMHFINAGTVLIMAYNQPQACILCSSPSPPANGVQAVDAASPLGCVFWFRPLLGVACDHQHPLYAAPPPLPPLLPPPPPPE